MALAITNNSSKFMFKHFQFIVIFNNSR